LKKPKSNKPFIAQFLAMIVLIQGSVRADANPFGDARDKIRQFEKDLAVAVDHNDVPALARYLADDWTIVSRDGVIVSRETFLKVMASGDFVHESMAPQDQTIRLYGNSAVVTARIQSGGTYKGAAFHTDEIQTDVLVKAHGHWVGVLRQLTTVSPQ
jgi:ketosteroid isomerase-like protein